MGIFKSKSAKELEKKLVVKKAINNMNKQISKLEEQKTVFIDKAKIAKKNGLEAQYNLALSGYKMTVMQQKRAQEMLLNFELTAQMKDMSMMTSEFLGGMSVLSKEMIKLTNNKEFLKIQNQFEQAMNGVEERTEQMDVFLDMSQESFKNSVSSEKSMSDEDFEKIITEQSSQDEDLEADIEKELKNIEKHLDSQKDN